MKRKHRKAAKKTSGKARKIRKVRKHRKTRKVAAPKKIRRRRKHRKVASHKKVRRHRKAAKRHVRKTHKKHATKKVSKRRKVSMKKHRRHRRHNPMLPDLTKPVSIAGLNLTGFDGMELIELAGGGLFYGAINGALPKIPLVGQLQALLMRVPVVGTSLTPFVLGAAMNIVGDKFFKGNQIGKILEHLGDGLIAASVVGMGVNASQMVPFLTPGGTVSGMGNQPQLGYAPQMGALPSPDFGGVDYTSGMQGVDYTPGMSGVDFTPGMSGVDFTPGMSGPDFGRDADFGLTPEGLYGDSLV